MKNQVKKNSVQKAGALFLTLSFLSAAPALAAGGPVMGGFENRMGMNQSMNAALADTASEIVNGTADNSASSIVKDTENASTIVMSDENSSVTITESGTYIVSGSCKDGSITVKKDTTGVYLVLSDLDLTSTKGAAVSVNKAAEVLIEVSGSVRLTDAENPEDETSEDTEVADAYDGAAIKVKAGAQVYMTGGGTLTVNGSAKNGIKTGDDSSLIISGEGLTVNITAANDGINANADLTILSGNVNVTAADDALHADRVLTIGSEGQSGPAVTVHSSTEGLEGTVVSIHSGNVTIRSSDDAVNAANADAAYEGELTYAINITGGTLNVTSGGDGLDSNGNINLVGGSVSIRSASAGGEAGIDYDGSLYISGDVSLNNQSGIMGPDGMGPMNGQFGPMNGQFGGGSTQPGQNGKIQPANFDTQPQMPGKAEADGQSAQTVPQFPSQNSVQPSQTMPQMPGQNGRMPFEGGVTPGQQPLDYGTQPQMPGKAEEDGQSAQTAPQFPSQNSVQPGQTMPQMPGQTGRMPFGGMTPGQQPEMVKTGVPGDAETDDWPAQIMKVLFPHIQPSETDGWN